MYLKNRKETKENSMYCNYSIYHVYMHMYAHLSLSGNSAEHGVLQDRTAVVCTCNYYSKCYSLPWLPLQYLC